MKVKELIEQKLIDSGSDTILIHSDLLQGFKIPFKDRKSFLADHMNELLSLKSEINIWMPAFNYNFCKGETYHVSTTPSQVGSLTEYFRKEVANWRTQIPVFSFSGIGEEPILNISDTIDPFGSESAFQELFNSDALLMHYGSLFHSTTILHYAERISDCLSYRYDKLFNGIIVNSSSVEFNVEFNFHVRPLGKYLDYDWPNIENDLIDRGILSFYKEGNSRILLCKIQDLIKYWISRIKQDPLYLLNNESKSWIEPLLDKLGRHFIITDFEPSQEL